MGANQYGAAVFWLSKNQYWLAAIVLVACAVVISRGLLAPSILQKITGFCAVCGFLVTLSAPFASVFHKTERVEHRINPPATGSASWHPDIILVTADSFAANHASFYGYSRPTTPYLDNLASEANVFERYYANCNYTTPTTNSFMNGVRPWTHRVNQSLAHVDAGISNQGLVVRLKQAGYQVFAVSSNHLAAPFMNGNDQWFDKVFYGRTHELHSIVFSHLGAYFPHTLPLSNMGVINRLIEITTHSLVFTGIWSPTDHFDPELALSVARRMLTDRNADRPLFLWVHLLAPHYPYASPEPFLRQFDLSMDRLSQFDSSPPSQFLASPNASTLSRWVGRYDEAIAYLDYHVGVFIDWLKRHENFDNVLLVISADHGESFSHSYGGHGGPMLHDDLIHIPLVIKEPGQNIGNRVDTLSEQIDLMPTILDLAGVPIEGSVEGRSLAPALRGQKRDGPIFSMNFEQNSCFTELNTGSVAMIEDHWKYVHYMGPIHYPMMPNLVDSLYDLTADPGENSNLITKQHVIAAKMLAAIKEQLRIHGKPVP